MPIGHRMESPMHTAENMLALKNTYFLLALGIVACSSSASRAPMPLEEDTSVKVPSFGNATPAPPPAETVPDETVEATPEDKPAAAPPPECPAEAEPNNDAELATEFTRCITGELTSWTDNDYLKITAPKTGVTDMIIDNIQPDGVINYSITAAKGAGAGQSNFNMSFTDKAPQTKITPGQTYVFQLKWDNNGQGNVSDKRTYALRVSFQ
jgi:hypothetical protein